MLFQILFLFAFSSLTAWPSYSLDFEIVNVVEVIGMADTSGIGQLKFSPSGSRLACIEGTRNWRSIVVVDTLGNNLKVMPLEFSTIKIEWVSENKIAVYMTENFDSFTKTRNRLSEFDIETGSEKIISDYETHKGWRNVQGKTAADGIYVSHEGTPYYRKKTFNEDGSTAKDELLSFQENDLLSIQCQHLSVWGDSGLYLRKLDKTDSTWLARKPFSRMGYFPKVSRDSKWAVDGGQFINLKDPSLVSLDTLIGPLPEKMFGCSVWGSVFNPAAPEVVFTIMCEGYATKENIGHHVDYESYRIAVFDCTTSKLTIINPLINMENAFFTDISVDGRRISFSSGRKSYILTRKFR